MRTHTTPPAAKVKVICNECGRKWQVSPNAVALECAKCGGADIDVREGEDMTRTQISNLASDIAGAAWDDRQRLGSFAAELRAVAEQAADGADGDLTDADRAKLRVLADEAESPDFDGSPL
jgi:predicted RNA-binding Zn-ribbon protein involved in translation (DUF1610 family)